MHVHNTALIPQNKSMFLSSRSTNVIKYTNQERWAKLLT